MLIVASGPTMDALYAPSDFKNQIHYFKLAAMRKRIEVLESDLEISSKNNEIANFFIAGIVGTNIPESLIESTKESIKGPSTGDNNLLEEVKNIYHK